MEQRIDDILAALNRSRFRRRFRLVTPELDYIRAKGLETVLRHTEDFIRRRLAPAEPARDGRQTPMRGHPAFIAQHATATCCRRCLAKWHRIPQGRVLNEEEVDYVLRVIERWLREHDPGAVGCAGEDTPLFGQAPSRP